MIFISSSRSCITEVDNVKHENEIDLFEAIDENVSFTECLYYCFKTYYLDFVEGFTIIENLFSFSILTQESKHKRTDRSVLCYLRKAQPGKVWPRLTKEKAKVSLTHAVMILIEMLSVIRFRL